MTRCLRARWVLPIAQPPLENGWIEIAGGRVVRVGSTPPRGGRIEDLGDVALMPGLINAHTHLELSWMAGRVPPAASMDTWIRKLIAVRRAGAPRGLDGEVGAARSAAQTMVMSGTVAAGDVANSVMTPRLFDECGVRGTVFHELIGFSQPDPAAAVRDAYARLAAERAERAPVIDRVSSTVVAHAPYSVSPRLFREIAGSAAPAVPLEVHLGESAEEIEFLQTGTGPFRRLLEDLGTWDPAWRAPGTDPVEYIEALGYLRPGMLAVHGVHLASGALARLGAAGAVLVTCPRSNVWVGAGPPDLARFYASGVPVAIGTDSLASVDSLNMFDELAAARRAAPTVPPSRLLESATRIGADALRLARDFGSLTKGKRAALVAVELPAGARAGAGGVEEYLVSGVPATAIRPVRRDEGADA